MTFTALGGQVGLCGESSLPHALSPSPSPEPPQGRATPSLVHCVPLRNVSDFPSDLLLILLFLLVYPNSLL